MHSCIYKYIYVFFSNHHCCHTFSPPTVYKDEMCTCAYIYTRVNVRICVRGHVTCIHVHVQTCNIKMCEFDVCYMKCMYKYTHTHTHTIATSS